MAVMAEPRQTNTWVRIPAARPCFDRSTPMTRPTITETKQRKATTIRSITILTFKVDFIILCEKAKKMQEALASFSFGGNIVVRATNFVKIFMLICP
jgi:hypothetical protein